MEVFIDMFNLTFMQRAFIAGLILGILLAALGVLASLRRMAFFGEGVAHASLAGIAIAVLTGFTPLPIAILWGILIASLIYLLEHKTKLSSDTSIGILFTTSMAIGVVLMSLTEGFQPELLSFLFGNILTITNTDIYIIGGVAAVILVWYFSSLRTLTLMSLSEEKAVIQGVNVPLQTLLLYIALAITTVLSVKILGIVLVSALLTIPPAITQLYTRSFKSYVLATIVTAEIVIFLGLVFSYLFDIPSGASIIITGASAFLLTSLFANTRTA